MTDRFPRPSFDPPTFPAPRFPTTPTYAPRKKSTQTAPAPKPGSGTGGPGKLAPKPSRGPKTAQAPSRRSENIDVSSADGGVQNPFGTGVAAFEPQTEIYQPTWDTHESDNPLLRGYADAYNAVQESRAKESEDAAATQAQSFVMPAGSGNASAGNVTATVRGGKIAGSGTVQGIISAARTMLGKPYVWGGTTSRGVDCSGLLYYAFNQAGIKMPRYRAVDYGRMGEAVDAKSARAGDIVYWDNPGTSTDHVGIYLGDGMVIQSPQSGDVTKISKVWGNAQFRRILDDDAFGEQATPTGATVASYNGKPASQVFGISSRVSVAAPMNLKGKFSGN